MLSVLVCSRTTATSKRIAADAARHGIDCKVRLAASGEEALALLARRPAEVLVVEALVALAHGALFLTRVRRAWPRTAVVVAGVSQAQLTAAAVAAGAHGVFGAGEDADELVCALVCSLLAERPGRPAGVPAQRRSEPMFGTAPTGRELQVLRAMSEGRSNAEIGGLLLLSEDTVKTHARRLYRRLGVRDRAHAVAAGFRNGLLT